MYPANLYDKICFYCSLLLKNIIKKDSLIYISFFIVVLLTKWNFLNLPFYYEERPFTVLSIDSFKFTDLILGNFNPKYFAGHPILAPLATNVFVKFYDLIGYTSTLQFKIHFFFTFIATGTLIFMYKIMNKVFNISWYGSICCSLILFSFPDYFIHSTNLRIDIFSAFFAIAFIYFRLSDNFKYYLLSGILLSQTRETVLAFFVTNLILDCYLYYKSRLNIKYAVASLIHLMFFSSFFIKTYLNKNKFSTSPAINEINQTLGKYLEVFWFDVKWLFIDDYRFILVALGLAFIFVLWKKKKQFEINFKVFYLILPIIFYILGMSFHIFEATYYFFPILPILYILITLPIFKVLSKKYVLLLLLIFLQFHFSLNKEKSKETMSENGTDYVDVIESFKKTHRYLEKFRASRINAEWPLDLYLSSSVYGYGKGYKQVSSDFEDLWATELGHNIDKKINCEKYNYDIIVVTEQSPSVKIESQMNIVKKCDYTLIKKIEVKTRVTKIYAKSEDNKNT